MFAFLQDLQFFPQWQRCRILKLIILNNNCVCNEAPCVLPLNIVLF